MNSKIKQTSSSTYVHTFKRTRLARDQNGVRNKIRAVRTKIAARKELARSVTADSRASENWGNILKLRITYNIYRSDSMYYRTDS